MDETSQGFSRSTLLSGLCLLLFFSRGPIPRAVGAEVTEELVSRGRSRVRSERGSWAAVLHRNLTVAHET